MASFWEIINRDLKGVLGLSDKLAEEPAEGSVGANKKTSATSRGERKPHLFKFKWVYNQVNQILQSELVPLFQEGLTEEEKVTLTPKFVHHIQAYVYQQENPIKCSALSDEALVAAIRHQIMKDWIDPGPDARRAALTPDSSYQEVGKLSIDIFKKAIMRINSDVPIVLQQDELEQTEQKFDALISQVNQLHRESALSEKGDALKDLRFASGQSDEESSRVKAFRQRVDAEYTTYGLADKGADDELGIHVQPAPAGKNSVIVTAKEIVPAPIDWVAWELRENFKDDAQCKMTVQGNIIGIGRVYRTFGANVLRVMLPIGFVIVTSILEATLSADYTIAIWILGFILFPPVAIIGASFITSERLMMRLVPGKGSETKIIASGTTSSTAWKCVQATIEGLKQATPQTLEAQARAVGALPTPEATSAQSALHPRALPSVKQGVMGIVLSALAFVGIALAVLEVAHNEDLAITLLMAAIPCYFVGFFAFNMRILKTEAVFGDLVYHLAQVGITINVFTLIVLIIARLSGKFM